MDRRFGIAILSNFYSIDPMNLGKKIADIYLSGSMSKAPSETSGTDEERKSKEDVILTPIGPNQFSGDREWADRILFLRNPDAGISGFRISASSVRSLLFTKTNR